MKRDLHYKKIICYVSNGVYYKDRIFYLQKGLHYKKNNVLPFFPCSVDPFSERGKTRFESVASHENVSISPKPAPVAQSDVIIDQKAAVSIAAGPATFFRGDWS